MNFLCALAALMPLAGVEGKGKAAMEVGGAGLEKFTQWMLSDFGELLRSMATPFFAVALVLATICFGLVVARRAGVPALHLPWSRRPA